MQHAKTQSPFDRGTPFSVKGEPAEEIYCLGAGSAKVTMTDARTGRQSLVKLVGPGDMLGYRCIFSAPRFRGTASALDESTACRISKNYVFDLIRRSPDFSLELLKRMGLEVAAAEYHHHSFCQKNVRERLAEALLILKEKFGRPSDLGWKIELRLTREELANWVGASRETVIRALTDFTVEGLVTLVDNEIHLPEMEKLRLVSGTTASALLVTGRPSPTA